MRTSFLLMFPLIMVATASLAQTPYETPPTIHAADLLPAEILTGKDYTIDPDVATDGFLGIFHIRSKFGDYECVGREMLYIRLSELNALEQLEQVSKTKAFLSAAASAAEEPVQAAVKIVTNPIGSAKAIPKGVGHLFKEVGGGFVDTGKSLGKVTKIGSHDDTPKPPPSREDPFGYNQFRNEWAVKLGVDPYTTNRVLAVKLNNLATIGFTTDKIAGVGIGFGLGGLGVIADYLSYLPDVDEHLLTAPPADVTEVNARKLKDLGVSKDDMKPLLENGWFSPSLQSRFVNYLVRLRGVNGLGNATRLAGGVQSEEEARFLCGSLEILDRYHVNNAALINLTTHAGLPAGVTADGTLVVGAPVDLLSWTETAADFSAAQPGTAHGVLCVTGLLTQRAQEGFKKQGWKVVQFSPP